MNLLMNVPVTFTNGLVTNGYGGVFYLLNANTVDIEVSSFSNFSSSLSGSFLYSTAVTLALTIQNNTFDCMTTAWTAANPNLTIYDKGGSFFIENAATVVTSKYNKFLDNYDAD